MPRANTYRRRFAGRCRALVCGLSLTFVCIVGAVAQLPVRPVPPLMSGSGSAIAATGNTTTPTLTPRAAPNSEALVGAGDLLEIRVFDVPDLSGNFRVTGAGELTLPLVGQFRAAGLSSYALANDIAELYRSRGFVLKPEVSVRVLEFTTQGITIEGQVKNPGLYPFYAPRPLGDVLALAGGVTTEADQRIQVRHRATSTEEIVLLPAAGLRSAKEEAVSVYPGDSIFVPKAGVVYVLGEVVRPGGIVMSNNGTLTILGALSEAQGMKRTADPKKAFVLRKEGEEYVRMALPLKPYEQGKKGDLELQSGDVLVVPVNSTKLFFQETSQVLASIGSASIYALAVH